MTVDSWAARVTKVIRREASNFGNKIPEITKEEYKMANQNNDAKIVELATSVENMVQQILSREANPYDKDIQNCAKSIMLRLNAIDHTNHLLAEATENCLVDILSCDNASWDTTPIAFLQNLEELKKSLLNACK